VTGEKDGNVPGLLYSVKDIEPNQLYRVKELHGLMRCSGKHLYDLFKRGVLQGPQRKPRRIFGSSVIAYLNDLNEPEKRQPPPAPEEPEAVPQAEPGPPRQTPRPTPGGRSRVLLPFPGRSR
jgi:hypothetical protein